MVQRPDDVGGTRDAEAQFDSTDEALAARNRLVASGVLNRFADRSGPAVVEEAEAVGH